MNAILGIDVIVLSYAQNDALKRITENCLSSLMASEDPAFVRFNVVVIESQKEMNPYQYPGTITIYPDHEFGYHTYMNLGIKLTAAPFVCLCNNDLIFRSGWATEIIKAFIADPNLCSASPICSIHHPTMGFELNTGVYPGYRIRYEIAGWCLFLKRDVFRLTGPLDENLKFWCADNDYSNTLAVLRLKHVLVSSSVVDHLETQTLNRQSEDLKKQLTDEAVSYYEKKWNYRYGEGWKLINS